MRTHASPTNDRRRRAAPLIAIAVAFAAIAGGCRTSPDLTPFTDSTAQLCASVKRAGRVVGEEVTLVTATWPRDQRAEAALIAGRFAGHWAERNALADALLAYSDSLAAIVDAGDQGERSARALADSFGRFCEAIDVVVLPAAAADVAVQSAMAIYGRFAKSYAARTLGEGMVQMQPFVDEVAGLLRQDLESVGAGLAALRVEAGDTINDSSAEGFPPRVERSLLAALVARRTELLKSLIGDASARDAARSGLLDADADARAAARERLDLAAGVASDIADELAAVEGSIALSRGRLALVDARIGAANDRLDAEIALVRAAGAGLGAWAAAHECLGLSALERRPPRVYELVQIAAELRDRLAPSQP